MLVRFTVQGPIQSSMLGKCTSLLSLINTMPMPVSRQKFRALPIGVKRIPWALVQLLYYSPLIKKTSLKRCLIQGLGGRGGGCLGKDNFNSRYLEPSIRLLIEISMLGVSSKQVTGIGNYRGIKSRSIFFKSRAFSGLEGVSNSVEANNKFIGVNSKV